jgi:hypothetical protein
MDVFDRSLSWHARVGAERIRDRGCEDCFAGVAEAGGGVAFDALGGGVVAYANLNTALYGLAPIDEGLFGLPLRLGIGPKVGLRLRPLPELVALVRGDLLALPAQSPTLTWSGSASLRWLYHRGVALSLEGQLDPTGQSLQAASSLYF